MESSYYSHQLLRSNYMTFYKGFVRTKNKKSIDKFSKNAKLFVLDEVAELDEYAGIIAADSILIDVDDVEQSKKLLKIVEDNEILCRVLESRNGMHFLFKNSVVDKCYTKVNLACGIIADIKSGFKNCYEVLKIDGKCREVLYDILEDEEYQELPKFLYPIKTKTDFLDMQAGDGRNQALFNYILTLQANGFSVDEARQAIRLINNYVFSEPLPADELETVLRDEAFQKSVRKIFPVCSENGKPIKTHWQNLSFLLKDWNYIVKYNQISHEIEFYKAGNRVELSFDDVITEIQGDANKNGLNSNSREIRAMLNYIAAQNAYNPFTAYLENSFDKWRMAGSKKDYFNTLCNSLNLNNAFVDSDKQKFLYKLLRKWLLQAVNIAYNNGNISPQGLLVLQGSGGIGKTQFVLWLLKDCPALVKCGETLNPNSKDSIIKVTKYALVELGELGRTLKDKDALKQFFTQNIDEYRAPYDIAVKRHPRRTSYIGTVNETDFLIDSTGERRYFILPLLSIDWNILNNLSPAMLWGEIYSAAKIDNETWYLNNDEIKMINEFNEKFTCQTSTEGALYARLDFDSPITTWKEWTPSDLAFALFADRRLSNRLGRVLAALAVKNKIPQPCFKHGNGATKFYKLPLLKR